MVIVECEQYTDQWWNTRLGVPTVSQFSKVATTKGAGSKSRAGYIAQLATECITRKPAGSTFQSYAMKRGHEEEGKARNLFGFMYDLDIVQTGLIFPDEQRRYAGSPDGLLDGSGLEIWCPESPAAVYSLLHQDEAIKLSGKFQQIQGSLLISGYDAWNFMMYYEGLKPLIIEVKRDNEFIEKLSDELDAFVLELAKTVKALKTL